MLEHDRDRRGHGVAAVLEVHRELVVGDPDLLLQVAKHVLVGLMHDHPPHVAERDLGAREQLLEDRGDAPDRELEDRGAVHVEVRFGTHVAALVGGLHQRLRADRLADPAALHDEVVRALPVGAEHERSERRRLALRRRDEHRACGVAEERADALVHRMDEARVRLGHDEQRRRRRARLDEAADHRETVGKCGAAEVVVERRRRRGQAEPLLEDAGRGR